MIMVTPPFLVHHLAGLQGDPSQTTDDSKKMSRSCLGFEPKDPKEQLNFFWHFWAMFGL